MAGEQLPHMGLQDGNVVFRVQATAVHDGYAPSVVLPALPEKAGDLGGRCGCREAVQIQTVCHPVRPAPQLSKLASIDAGPHEGGRHVLGCLCDRRRRRGGVRARGQRAHSATRIRDERYHVCHRLREGVGIRAGPWGWAVCCARLWADAHSVAHVRWQRHDIRHRAREGILVAGVIPNPGRRRFVVALGHLPILPPDVQRGGTRVEGPPVCDRSVFITEEDRVPGAAFRQAGPHPLHVHCESSVA